MTPLTLLQVGTRVLLKYGFPAFCPLSGMDLSHRPAWDDPAVQVLPSVSQLSYGRHCRSACPQHDAICPNLLACIHAFAMSGRPTGSRAC